MPPPPPRGRRRGGSPPGSGNAMLYVVAALLACVGFAVIGIIAWTYSHAPGHVDVDKLTGCPVGGPNKAQFIIVDTTDALPEMSKKQVEQALMVIAGSARKGELLEVRTIDTGSTAGTLQFSKCSPGDGSDEDITTGNPEKTRKRWQADFIKPFQGILPGILDGELGKSSPILETLQAIAVERVAPLRQAGVPVELLVISDMRQHSSAFSHYKSNASYADFKGSAAYRNLHTDLGGASLAIKYVQRQTPRIDEQDHLQFWMDWANDNGAVLETVERLQGEN